MAIPGPRVREGTYTMMAKNNDSRIETTLEDLFAAASELAFEYCDNDKDGYNLARLALIELLRKTTLRSDPTRELENLPSPSPLIH